MAKKKVIRFILTGGPYFEDYEETTDFLTENDSFFIANADEVIAKHLYNLAQNTFEQSVSDKKILSTTLFFGNRPKVEGEKPLILSGTTISTIALDNILSYERFLEAVSSGREIKLTGSGELDKVGYKEISFHFNGKNEVEIYYHNEQFNYIGSYDIVEIEEENIRFIAAENFLNPIKSIASSARFYHEPFMEQESALEYMKTIPIRKHWNSRKELYVVDITEMQDSKWFQDNMFCIKNTKDVTMNAGFSEFASIQRKYIEERDDAEHEQPEE